MGTSTLTIDLNAVAANWRSLDAMSDCETAAVVKANGYGLGAPSVARALAKAGGCGEKSAAQQQLQKEGRVHGVTF